MAQLCISKILAKNCDFFIPPAFNAPVRGSLSDYCHNFVTEKLEWCGNPTVKKVLEYVYLPQHTTRIRRDRHRMDRRTDRHRIIVNNTS